MSTVLRSFQFEATASIASVTASLPSHSAVLDHALDWNKTNRHIPKYLNVATIAGGLNNGPDEINLMGPPIHARNGDDISVIVKNSLSTTGLSIHWHGFEMEDSMVYDGVVGVTQCPISPSDTFAYNFSVNETPGTYWYHTHSGELGIDAYNAIKGPLIVHPSVDISGGNGNEDERKSAIAAMLDQQDEDSANYDDRLFYDNERILFFSDGSHFSDSKVYLQNLGSLNPPISFSDDFYRVGTFPWNFGTCNGVMREIVPVSPGRKYKMRLINAGHLFALRIAMDGFKFTIVAADSEPVEPYVVDEVILHTAERFDVEIEVPANAKVGSTSWIRADTLESFEQGYKNGIRAILYIVDDEDEQPFKDEEVLDPLLPIATEYNSLDRVTMNCLSTYEAEEKGPNGGCIPITKLRHINHRRNLEREDPYGYSSSAFSQEYEVHTIDFEWSASPQFAHFTSIDEGPWLQHSLDASNSMMHTSFDLAEDLHPHAAVLNVEAHSTAILIWRNKSQMDHPIHLHGLKMEILDVHNPKKAESCVLNNCSLSKAFSSKDTLDALAATPQGAVLKDTFILPAGGAVAVRIKTGDPSLWFAHCHLETHREDGMALILNVGNYQAPSDGSWLPQDYPRCDTPFLETKVPFPSCKCFSNKDAVLAGALSDEHWCSRDHLCFHEYSEGKLDSYPVASQGLHIQSQYRIPGWAISLIAGGIVVLISVFCAYQSAVPEPWKEQLSLKRRNKRSSLRKTVVIDNEYNSKEFDLDPERNVKVEPEAAPISFDSPFWYQLQELLVSQWGQYRPTAINGLRVVEVVGLALLTGALFYDIGNDTTATGFVKVNSLLFFSVTLWTFTRMYTSVGSTYLWYIAVEDDVVNKRNYAVGPLYLSRLIVVMLAESFWPFLYVFVCYPLASVVGDWTVVIKIGMLLCLNNAAYISLGSCLGVLFPSIPQGMIASTLFSQTSLVAAGFYTTLPVYLSWIRYSSPVFWTFSGIVKAAYTWSDTYKCIKGSNLAGNNRCFIETSPVIDDMKERGINAAVYGDAQSDNIWLQVCMLILLLFLLQTTIYITVNVRCSRRKKAKEEGIDDSERSAGSAESKQCKMSG
ncbi:unnamed protein product [Pseudo-nitzschia multistriata]|uniref:ABC-2 type transporter domain-containing protein n=1 Tax=Pseudo-nitzschia multistriata TaxID=183589 RepID=A0A448Z8R1_9STRA|nr:unnamed protein product [Pseudo-nitzschia multistriata]